MADAPKTDALGPNAWLVDEMYEEYLANPNSVSESWREFFADYQRDSDVTASPVDKSLPASGRTGDTGQVPVVVPGQAPATKVLAPKPAAADGEVGDPLRGAAARIVENMEASLEVPTATSFREVPAKLLEVNRKVINGYLGRTRGGKVSFTHLIGYAIVRAVVDAVPHMNSTFVEGSDGKPR
ncbi:MAG TPA: 2-oxo acid dehydrogenase subunit E2, partial [Acidimicrobiales bacterium]